MSHNDWQMLYIWVAFLVMAKAVLAIPWSSLRLPLFAITNLVAVYGLHYYQRFENKVFVIYIVFVASFLMLLNWCVRNQPAWVIQTAWLPIIALIMFKFLPATQVIPTLYWVGFSYMAFRLSALSADLANNQGHAPSLAEGLSFAFFLPTFMVGPINPLVNHQAGLACGHLSQKDAAHALLRILVGIIKFRFLCAIALQFTFNVLWKDGNNHGIGDFFLSGIAYYLYLYLNFSGFVDICIGSARLLGIPVSENFDNPFSARNIKLFWSKWHMTLTRFINVMLYNPMNRLLLRQIHPRHILHVTAMNSFLAFLIIGIWHGNGWNFVFFGLWHAIAVVWLTYWGQFLKGFRNKRLYLWINHPAMRTISVTITFLYVSIGFFFFENDLSQMKSIFEILLIP